jgi:hypothetical protein
LVAGNVYHDDAFTWTFGAESPIPNSEANGYATAAEADAIAGAWAQAGGAPNGALTVRQDGRYVPLMGSGALIDAASASVSAEQWRPLNLSTGKDVVTVFGATGTPLPRDAHPLGPLQRVSSTVRDMV